MQSALLPNTIHASLDGTTADLSGLADRSASAAPLNRFLVQSDKLLLFRFTFGALFSTDFTFEILLSVIVLKYLFQKLSVNLDELNSYKPLF